MSKQEFCVEVTQTTRHKFCIEANSPEEAISVAESYLEDGEVGEITETLVEDADAYPCDEGEC